MLLFICVLEMSIYRYIELAPLFTCVMSLADGLTVSARLNRYIKLQHHRLEGSLPLTNRAQEKDEVTY